MIAASEWVSEWVSEWASEKPLAEWIKRVSVSIIDVIMAMILANMWALEVSFQAICRSQCPLYYL